MSEVLRAKPGNLPRSDANPVVVPASSESRRPERVPALDRFVRDRVPPASRTVPQPPAAHGSAASLLRCPPESFSWPRPHVQSALAWPSRPTPEWSDVPRASSVCIPTAQPAAPGPPIGQLRCPLNRPLACLQDPILKRLIRSPYQLG